MKTKHILLLGLGSLTATAAIATPIALVNSDFGGGGKPTRIVVGNVNNDSATLEIPFSEKISSTKATVTLVYENKEEQVEAEIVNDNDGTKVILTNLKPNTKYQIKEMKIDDKIINFKDSQFATKDNTLEQDVVVKPNEEQKLPKTVDKTDENKEESKKSDNQQEDKHEQGKSTKVEEPVVTPGVGAQEPAVSLPQKVESKEADNSAEKQKEEKPKDQTDDSGPLSNISEQNEGKQSETETKQETEKTQEKTQPKVENSNLETSVQDSQNQNEASGSVSTSPQVNSSSEIQTQNQISSSAEQPESAPKDLESVSRPSTATSTPSDTSSVENTQKTEETPAQTLSQATSPDSSNASESTQNPGAIATNQGTSSHTNNLQADTSTTIKVGYWRVDQYSTKNEELTNFIVKIINELKLSLLVLTDISQGAKNDGAQIVSELNKNTGLPWKQITGSSDSTGKSKRKVSFIYNSQFVHLTSNNETVKLSATDPDDYTIPPALVKFETKNSKSFSIVSSVLKSNSRKKGKGKEKPKGAASQTNNPAEKLKEQLSTLIGSEQNVIFIGDSGISTKNPDTESPLNKDYKFINLEENSNDSTIFTKNGADFQTEHPSLFDISKHQDKDKVTKNKPKRNPIFVDLKFN